MAPPQNRVGVEPRIPGLLLCAGVSSGNGTSVGGWTWKRQRKRLCRPGGVSTGSLRGPAKPPSPGLDWAMPQTGVRSLRRATSKGRSAVQCPVRPSAPTSGASCSSKPQAPPAVQQLGASSTMVGGRWPDSMVDGRPRDHSPHMMRLVFCYKHGPVAEPVPPRGFVLTLLSQNPHIPRAVGCRLPPCLPQAQALQPAGSPQSNLSAHSSPKALGQAATTTMCTAAIG